MKFASIQEKMKNVQSLYAFINRAPARCVLNIAKQFNKLTDLYQFHDQFTAQAFLELNIQQLQRIDLRFVDKWTDEMIKSLVENIPNIKVIRGNLIQSLSTVYLLLRYCRHICEIDTRYLHNNDDYPVFFDNSGLLFLNSSRYQNKFTK